MYRNIRCFVLFLMVSGWIAPAFCIDLGDLNPTDPAKGTIDDAKKAASDLLAEAQRTGNGLESNLASQLDAVAQSALLLLGNDLSKNIGQLNTAEQQALVALVKLQKSIKVDLDKAYDLKDTTVVDLTQWESGWWICAYPRLLRRNHQKYSIPAAARRLSRNDHHLWFWYQRREQGRRLRNFRRNSVEVRRG